jgi:DNA-binding transcriptional LysR family regulator
LYTVASGFGGRAAIVPFRSPFAIAPVTVAVPVKFPWVVSGLGLTRGWAAIVAPGISEAGVPAIDAAEAKASELIVASSLNENGSGVKLVSMGRDAVIVPEPPDEPPSELLKAPELEPDSGPELPPPALLPPDGSAREEEGPGLPPACRAWRSGMKAFATARPAINVILPYIIKEIPSKTGQNGNGKYEKPKNVQEQTPNCYISTSHKLDVTAQRNHDALIFSPTLCVRDVILRYALCPMPLIRPGGALC